MAGSTRQDGWPTCVPARYKAAVLHLPWIRRAPWGRRVWLLLLALWAPGCRPGPLAPLRGAALPLPAAACSLLPPASPQGAPSPRRCRRPTAAGGALQLAWHGHDFAAFDALCDQLAQFAAVPKLPAPQDVARVQNGLQGLGYFAEVRCSTLPAHHAVACDLAPAPIVRSLHFSGHLPFALFTDDLRRRVSLRPGTVLTNVHQQLDDQAKRLTSYLHQEGYFDAAVAITPSFRAGAEPHCGTHLEIAVSAHQTAKVRRVEVQGSVPLATQALVKHFFHRGFLFYVGRFRPLQLGQDVERATALLHDAGYVGARVSASYSYDAAARAVDIGVTVHAGPKVRWRLEGERLLDARALRKAAPFAETGAVDAVAVEQMRQAVLRRAQENGFADAEVSATTGHGIEPHTRVVTLHAQAGAAGKLGVGSVRVVGAQRLPAWQLLAATHLLQKVGRGHRQPFVQAFVDHDAAALQATLLAHGFFAATVQAQRSLVTTAGRRSIAVTYRVQEGPRATVATSEVVGCAADEPLCAQLAGQLGLQPGAAYTEAQQENDVQQVQLAAAKRGYINAHVYAETTALAAAAACPAQGGCEDATRLFLPQDLFLQVKVHVATGPRATLAGTFLRGNFRTRTSTLLQELSLKLHQPVSLHDLGAAKRTLRATNLFDSVQLMPKTFVEGDPNTWLLLALEERDVRTLDGIASFSSDYLFALGAEYRDINWLGRAMQLDLTARLADASDVVPHVMLGRQDFLEASLRAPHPFGLPLLAEASARYLFFNLAEYNERRIEAQTAISRTFFRQRRCKLCPSLSLRLAYEVTEGFRKDKTHGQTQQAFRADPVTIARIVPSLNLDSRDSLTDPRRGYNVDVRLEGGHPTLAGLLEARATAFWRLLAAAQVFLPLGAPMQLPMGQHSVLGGPWVLALAVNYGAAGPFGPRGGVPHLAPYSFGGDNDVRGLKNRASNALLPFPDYLLTASAELRWYLLENLGFGSLQLAGFVDFGAVSAHLAQLGQGPTLSAGPALRYVTPVGPLSLAYGRALVVPFALRHDPDGGAPRHGRFHFTFGYTF